jgi:Arcadin 1
LAKVKVNRITSVNDPHTGQPCKQIELVEFHDVRPPQAYSAGDEGRVIQGMLSQLQSMGLVPQVRDFGFPKVTMVLTETEYDMLGVRLDVNEVYELDIKNGSLELRKSTEGT